MSGTVDAPSEPLLAGRVARGALATSVRTLAGYLVAAAAMVVLTRKLSPSEFGIYSVLVASSTIAFQAVTTGFAYAFNRSEQEASPAVVDAAFWAFELVYAVAAAGMMAASVLLSSRSADIILFGLAGFLLLAPFRFPMLVRCWRRLEMGRLALIDFCELAVLQLGAMVLVLAGVGPEAFAYAVVAGALTSAVLSMVLMRWRPSRPRLAPLRPWMSEVRPLMASGVLMLVRDNGSAPLLSVVFGTAVAGYYGWAAGVTAALVALASVFGQTMFLGFSRAAQDRDRTADGLRRALRFLFLFMCAVVAVAGGAAQPLTMVVFTSKWLPALLGLRLLLAALALATVLSLFINLALVLKRVKVANRCLAGVCVLAVALGLPAAHLWGMPGYAGSLLIATVTVMAYAWVDAQRLFAIGVSTARFAVATCVSAGVAVAIGALAFSDDSSGVVELIGAASASAGVFIALALALTRGEAWRVFKDAAGLLRA